MSRQQSGNVLFLILIAVALFAALSYAVTSSTRSGGTDASSEKSRLYASAIVSYGASLQSTVQRMKLSNSCSDEQFDFSNPIYKTGHGALTMAGNTNSPGNDSCDLFSPAGGNLAPYIPTAEALGTPSSDLSHPKPGHGMVRVEQITNIGTDAAAGTEPANDIVFSTAFLGLNTCLQINNLLGIANINGAPPAISKNAGGNGGNYTNGSLAATLILSNASINGFQSFCASSASGYTFYQVLVAR